MTPRIQKAATSAPRWAIYALGLVPALWLIFAAFTNRLGPDPVKTLENQLGEWAIWFLIAGLAVTPLLRLASINLLKYRRALGLVAFAYVVLHLTTYLLLDRALDGSAVVADLLKRPYIMVGAGAFLLLVPLAVTSNDGLIRKLGPARWRKLHKLVYPAAVLATLHYLMLVKTWRLEPLVYLALVLTLLALRRLPKRSARASRQGRSCKATSTTSLPV